MAHVTSLCMPLAVTLWHAPALPQQLSALHDISLVGIIRMILVFGGGCVRTLLCASKELVACNEISSATSAVYSRPISIVHPDIYLSRLQALQSQIQQFQQIAAFLGSQGIFRARVTRESRVDVTKIAEK
jgi:hypothetical protein